MQIHLTAMFVLLFHQRICDLFSSSQPFSRIYNALSFLYDMTVLIVLLVFNFHLMLILERCISTYFAQYHNNYSGKMDQAVGQVQVEIETYPRLLTSIMTEKLIWLSHTQANKLTAASHQYSHFLNVMFINPMIYLEYVEKSWGILYLVRTMIYLK